MMNKLPAKQIYLLGIIVFGIIALSIYSTYAIFTYEASTEDILSINTPNSLSLMESTTKYKQLIIPKDTVVTTDIDIYDYNVCYTIWYNIEGKNKSLQVYENTTSSLTTSGALNPVSGARINLLVINDGDAAGIIKLGVKYMPNNGQCSLELDSNKKQITDTINSQNTLEKAILATQVKNDEMGYLTYSDIEKELPINKELPLAASKKFDYKDETFTLQEPINVEYENIPATITNNGTYYTCLTDESCKTLYRINEIVKKDDKYVITKYDALIGYSQGESGLRKNNNDYYFYGDNPHNFVYYNCTNESNTKTCELWRIIGLTYDQEHDKYIPKIIRDDYLENQKYADDSEEWENSDIKKYFEKDYKLVNESYIKEVNFKQENITTPKTKLNDITIYGKEYKQKISLMQLSDYLNASVCSNRMVDEYTADCLTKNWLNRGNREWTMTMNYLEPEKDEETGELIPVENNKIYTVGAGIETTTVDTELALRPVVYLKTRMLITSGDGTVDNPYIIR